MGAVQRQVSAAFLVAVSAVIAVTMSIFPRWVTRLVLVGLVLSCLPQLLDNTEAQLYLPVSGFYLTAYFGLYSNGRGQGVAYQTSPRCWRSDVQKGSYWELGYFEYYCGWDSNMRTIRGCSMTSMLPM